MAFAVATSLVAFAAATASAASGFVPVSVEPPSAAVATDSLAPVAVEARSLRLRMQLGLSTDDDRVARLARDREAVSAGLSEYGIPLTRGERAQMVRREHVAAAAGRLQQRLDDSREYAGRYIDQRAGGLIYLGYTAHLKRRLARARERFRYPERLRVFKARYSNRQLLAAQRRLTSSIERLSRGGVEVASVGIDDRRNQLRVMVDSDVRTARRALLSHGDMVAVERGSLKPTACVGRLECAPPLRAGLDIETESDLHCATGFIGYDAKSSDELPPSTSLDYFMLTAGHCALEEGADDVWYHGGEPIGQVSDNYYHGVDGQADTSAFDGAVIPISDELAANLMYTTRTSTGYPVRAVEAIDTDAVGDSVCISTPYYEPIGGATREGSKCGFLTARGVYTTGPDGSSLISQRMAQIANVRPAVRESDSGSPVVKNAPNRAVGVINQAVWAPPGDTDLFIYSQIGFLNAYSNTSGSTKDYRVLTGRGPGGGQGDIRCTAVPGEPVPVPKRTTDETYASYAACLTALGLVPARVTKAHIDADMTKLPDTALSVSPAEGSSVPAGSTVTVTTNPALDGTLKAASDALIANNPDAANSDADFSSKTAPLVAQECLKLAAMSRTITEPNDRVDEDGNMVDDKMPDEMCGNSTTPAKPIFLAGAVSSAGTSQLEATQHDIDALGLNPDEQEGSYPGWFRLNWQTKPRTGWYTAYKETGKDTLCAGTIGDSTDCDEFPFHSTEQGGRPAVPLPHLRVISASANRSQGNSLLDFKITCGIPEGGEFLVVPSTVLPTNTSLCSAG
jgi:hypothetical protein